ncbi:mycofactocin system transcriptional regulator [Microbacterium sp.]|uniref:mycofactocin system transcriptional regulator n=1 Tax=Microbacterium sp. TaxID=51671 RepID=UPI0037CA3CF4
MAGRDDDLVRSAVANTDALTRRIGRAPATTHGEISHVALRLFLDRGFEKTTIDDIVEAAGIGRRTFFRYFRSKSDLPWGEFDLLLEEMRRHLAALPAELPLLEALRVAIVAFNDYPESELALHRERMWLLLNVPALFAHSSLRYADWRQVIAEFVAGRMGVAVDAPEPQAIAWACLGLCLASYEQWLAHPDADLQALIENAFDLMSDTFSGARA